MQSSVNNIFMMNQEDTVVTHMSKYTMNMSPSDFASSKNKKYEKYNCFIVCKHMKKYTYVLQIVMSWESGSVCRMKLESDILGTFSNSYEFKRPMVFKRYSDITQTLAFDVWDYENRKILGRAKFDFTPNHSEKDFFVTLPIICKQTQEEIGVIQSFFSRIEKTSREFIALEVEGHDLANVDAHAGDKSNFDKSDPFLVFHRLCEEEVYIPIYCTTAVMDNLNPRWEKVILSIDELSGGNPNNLIKIECWDWQEDYRYQFIGESVTTLNKMLAKPTLILNGRSPARKTGELKIKAATKLIKPAAIDFLTTQDKFAFVLGIDFSIYNNKPYNRKDLHALDRFGSNSYLKVIEEISKMMWGQDTDGKIPCFAFGGRPSFPDFNFDRTHSLIPLSGNNHKMSILSPDKLVEAYKNALDYIEPSAPVSIVELLKLIHSWGLKDIKSNLYYVVIILTSGQVDELQQSIDVLVEMANLPVSIVLVGVGNHDFSVLEKLDGDKRWLRNSKKKLTTRDIVNFVDFEECFGNSEKFAKKLLEEFPEQFMSFKLMSGYKPR